MTDIVRTMALGLCSALLLAAPESSEASPRKTPKGTVLCLPPGSSGPKPCASLAAGAPMALQADEDFEGNAILRFRPRGAAMGSQPIDVPIAAGSLRRGQLYRFTLPPQLCAGRTGARSGQRLQFEIQVLTADMQQAGSDHASVGLFQQQTGWAWSGNLDCAGVR